MGTEYKIFGPEYTKMTFSCSCCNLGDGVFPGDEDDDNPVCTNCGDRKREHYDTNSQQHDTCEGWFTDND